MECGSALNESVLSGSPIWCPLEVEMFDFDVRVNACSLFVVESCEHLYVRFVNALF